jgi:hypothetical protein
VGFCVTEGIPLDFAAAKSCFDLSSDHSPILITLTADTLNQQNEPNLSNRQTNWDDFRRLVNETLTLNISLKTEEHIEVAAKFFNDSIQWQVGMQCRDIKRTLKAYDCSIIIKQKIEEERRDAVENGADYEDQQARDYLMQQHRNSKISSITTKVTASKHSCKDLHQQNSLPLESDQKTIVC